MAKQQVMLRQIATKLGVDKAILYTSSAKIVQGLGGIVSVLMITQFLTSEEQGFYYTFASLLAIQIFFEFGLNGIITQYVAHEVVHLKLIDGHYVGDDKYLSRAASLLVFCLKWYLLLALVFLIGLIVLGFVFFSSFYHSPIQISWELPWILVSIGTVLVFIISPMLAYLEGLGYVKEIAKIRFIQQIVCLAVLWSSLFIGMKLYVSGIVIIVGAIVLACLIYKTYGSLLANILKVKITERVSYRKEIFPFQWKITISAMGGYLIFQLFNPVIFATSGAVVAGQMGMTISVLNAVLFLTFGWMATKIPTFSGLIAQRDYKALDKLFKHTFWSSSIVNFLGLVVVFIVMVLIRYLDITISGRSLSDRFLPMIPMLFMMVPILLNHMISAMATYLRCHKKEPMLGQSVVIGILCATSVFVFGKLYGIIGITAGYMVITVIGFIWTCIIFYVKRKQWHNE